MSFNDITVFSVPSDHYFILFNINIQNPLSNRKKISFRKFNEINKDIFLSDLNDKFSSFDYNNASIDQLAIDYDNKLL